MTIGKNIKIKRKQTGITQKILADYIGKSLRMVQKYENDDVTPNIKTLQSIADALEIRLNDLLSVNVTDENELVKDAFNFLKEIINSNKCYSFIGHEPTLQETIEDFKTYFSISLSKPDGEIDENTITQMLCTIININLEKFMELFRIYKEFIFSFSKQNLFLIDKTLGDFNLSFEKLETDQINGELNTKPSDLPNDPSNSITSLYEIYSSLNLIDDATLNDNILSNIYNDSDFKDCLIYLKKKHILKYKFNQEGNKNGN